MDTPRTPALICVGLSAAQIVCALLGLAVPAFALGAEPIGWFVVLLAVLHVQQPAAALAVARSGYAGNGGMAVTGLVLAGSGGVAFAAGELLYLVDPGVADPVFTVASLASGVGMVLVGIAVLRVGRWAGPARLLPVAVGAYVFLVLTPVLVATSAGLVAIAGWAALWLLLGLALWLPTRVRATAR